MVPLREGALVAGRYRLERALARGGMGTVWVAHHLGLDVPVAVKFMDTSTSPSGAATAEALARFEREARSAARVQSQHVVKVLDHGTDGDLPYIVMELLEGEHLGERLKRERRLPLTGAAMLAIQIAKALRAAHAASIVHRDLKPSNVFLAKVDGEEVVKVLDFGIAKASPAGAVVTRTGAVMGSPSYMSPEQARAARTVDHRADLWSLGMILFRALTGELAFRGESEVDVIVKICTDPIPRPSSIAPDLSPAIDAWFVRALDRDPARRFQSATEMAATFAAVARPGGTHDGGGADPAPRATRRGSPLLSAPSRIPAIVPYAPPGCAEAVLPGASILRELLRAPPYVAGRVAVRGLDVAPSSVRLAGSDPTLLEGTPPPTRRKASMG